MGGASPQCLHDGGRSAATAVRSRTRLSTRQLTCGQTLRTRTAAPSATYETLASRVRIPASQPINYLSPLNLPPHNPASPQCLHAWETAGAVPATESRHSTPPDSSAWSAASSTVLDDRPVPESNVLGRHASPDVSRRCVAGYAPRLAPWPVSLPAEPVSMPTVVTAVRRCPYTAHEVPEGGDTEPEHQRADRSGARAALCRSSAL